jgi:tetratricopeptide (TPR) repeat protein
MDNLDYIERYFTSEPDKDGTREFEERIASDPAFAEEVAFYLSAHHVARESSRSDKRNFFKEVYKNYQPANKRTTLVRKLVYAIAAAAVVAGIVFGTYNLMGSDSPKELAGQYVKENLQTLGVTMSSRSDSIQDGLRLYNEGKPAEALLQFEKIVQSDSSNSLAKKYAGLSALQLKDYEKALIWFRDLGSYDKLYSNPGLFYQALTLMERDLPGDVAESKLLLQRVVDNKLEGKETAAVWLKKLH